ncbi:hypothetical protein NP493_1692g00008 [Ridgeia piscesae]|uniref:Uncharacterized protein n=1 Tax=Ridgeia piscesae TaxID=27915 RepID=A0AAD9N8X1_RIDPI|nr:hypothetical protein NP493_1692g00008 [Ridgeia piscesae]
MLQYMSITYNTMKKSMHLTQAKSTLTLHCHTRKSMFCSVIRTAIYCLKQYYLTFSCTIQCTYLFAKQFATKDIGHYLWTTPVEQNNVQDIADYNPGDMVIST